MIQGLMPLPEDEVFSPEQRRNGLLSGFLNAAGTIGQLAGPSPYPTSLGAILARGLGSFGQGQSDALMGGMKVQQAKQQMDMNKVNLQQAQDKQAALKELNSIWGFGSPQPNGEIVQPAGMTPGATGQPGTFDVAALRSNPNFMNAYARAYGPQAAIELATKKPGHITAKPGDVILGEDMKPLYSVPEKQEPTELEKTLIAAGVPRGSPEWNRALLNYAQRKGEGAKTTINMPQDDGLTEYWKQLGKKLPDLESQARSAVRTNASLADMVKMGESKTYSGMLAPGAIGASQFLESLGVKYQPEILSNTREFEAQKNILVLDFMASMGGARGFSKEESAVLYDAFPKIIDSPEARSRIAKMLMNRNNLVIEDYNSTRDQFESATGKKLPSPRFAPGTAPSPGGNSGPTPEAARAELERRRKAVPKQ